MGAPAAGLGKKIGTYGCLETMKSEPHGHHLCALWRDLYYPEGAEKTGWVEVRHDGPHHCRCGHDWPPPEPGEAG